MRIHSEFRFEFAFAKFSTLVVAVVLSSATLAAGQGPTQFLGDLQTRIQKGETVHVIDVAGRITKGKFEGISNGSVRLLADGKREEFLQNQIREIRKRRPESRWDGVLVGLGVGAVAGFVNVRMTCNDASERADCFAVGHAIVLPLFAGGGAGVGALIDFAIQRHDIVFSQPVRSSYRFRLSPIVDARGKGLWMSVSF